MVGSWTFYCCILSDLADILNIVGMEKKEQKGNVSYFIIIHFTMGREIHRLTHFLQ